jgi:hypothetical protein
VEPPGRSEKQLLGERNCAGDDDLVRGKRRERVGDRKQRIGVGHASLGVEPASLELLEVRGQPFRSPSPGAIFVGSPAPKPRVKRRRDDEQPPVRRVQWSAVEGHDEDVSRSLSEEWCVHGRASLSNV